MLELVDPLHERGNIIEHRGQFFVVKHGDCFHLDVMQVSQHLVIDVGHLVGTVSHYWVLGLLLVQERVDDSYHLVSLNFQIRTNLPLGGRNEIHLRLHLGKVPLEELAHSIGGPDLG